MDLGFSNEVQFWGFRLDETTTEFVDRFDRMLMFGFIALAGEQPSRFFQVANRS